jgi:radical SAM protein with 4Fe4S-binding SPASM domain
MPEENTGVEHHIPRSLLVQWHVTERCNLRCAHCYQDAYKGQELKFKDQLGILHQIMELLALWRRTCGRRLGGHITVTGGEPFARPDFPDLIKVFSANRGAFSYAILTNGSLIDQDMANWLGGMENLGPSYVQVSVEGNRETHDRIRGEGNFDITAAAIERLVRAGLRTVISFTAHRGNFREFPEVARLGRSLKVARVWADRLIPHGSGAAMRDLVLSPDETREFFQIMKKARREGGLFRAFQKTEIAMHRALQFLVGGGTAYKCVAGDQMVTIQPNGDVYPCRRMPVRVGNLLKTPLQELYYSADLFRALRDQSRLDESCLNCRHAQACGGGLRCLSQAVNGDPFQPDPGCWLV